MLSRLCKIICSFTRRLRQTLYPIFDSHSEVLDSSNQAQQACQKAQSILTDLKANNHAAICNEFSTPLRWFVTPRLLQTAWDSVAMLAGPLMACGEPVVRRGWFGTTLVNIPVQFKRMEMVVRIRMTSSGGLIGFKISFLTAAESEGRWIVPEYIDRDSFVEFDLKLGTGWLRVGATLTMPRCASSEDRVPCVVLIAGSGPCDRDSSVGALKPFRDIAFGLASRGIAVIRFDKVTYSHPWWFHCIRSNHSITLEDEYMKQALEAVKYVKRHPMVDSHRVSVLGHSLGAWVAPRVVVVTEAAGLILMAAPARMMYYAALDQMRYLASLDGQDAKSTKTIEDLVRRIRVAESPDLNLATQTKALPFGLGARYWLAMRSFKPIREVKNLDKPVMVLQGRRDFQVTVSADYSRWLEGLDDMSTVHTHLYEGLNHLFVVGEEPSTTAEYFEPGNVDKIVVHDLTCWILAQKP